LAYELLIRLESLIASFLLIERATFSCIESISDIILESSMKSRLATLTTVFAFVACSFVTGCGNDAPEANVLEPGAKPNSPASGPAGLDGKTKTDSKKTVGK